MDLKTVYADEQGNIVDAPQDFLPLAGRGAELIQLKPEDLIPLPKSAALMCLPERKPFARYGEEELPIMGHTVAAILPKGYIRTYLPAYAVEEGAEDDVFNYPYAPVVAYKDQLYVAAQRLKGTYDNPFQQYNTRNLHKLVKELVKKYPQNRLVEYMGQIALEEDGSYTAQDLFYQRGEVALPLGKQKLSTGFITKENWQKERPLKFNPSGAELAQVGFYHLQEGNILTLGADMLEDIAAAEERLINALGKLKNQGVKGKINLYTIGIATETLGKLAENLDYLTLHLATPEPGDYPLFYGEHSFKQVEETLAMAKEQGLKVICQINFIPGYTDGEEMLQKWVKLIRTYDIKGIIVNNPWLTEEAYQSLQARDLEEPVGYDKWLATLEAERVVASDLAMVIKELDGK